MKFDTEKKGYKKSEVDEYVFALKNEYESKLAEQKNRIFQLKNELTEKENSFRPISLKPSLSPLRYSTRSQRRMKSKSLPLRVTVRK